MSIWLRGEDKDSGPITGRGLLGTLWLTLFQPLSPDCLFARRVFSRSKVRGVMLMLISLRTAASGDAGLRQPIGDQRPHASCGRTPLTKCLAGSWSSPS
jgi:hypothetical protein